MLEFSEEKKRDVESVSSELHSSDESDTESGSSRAKTKRNVIVQPRRPSVLAGIGRHHYGSFYLRMGAVGKHPFNY